MIDERFAISETADGVIVVGDPAGIVPIPGPAGPPGQDGAGLSIRGSVQNAGALPVASNTAGDAYLISAPAGMAVWDGAHWVTTPLTISMLPPSTRSIAGHQLVVQGDGSVGGRRSTGSCHRSAPGTTRRC